MVGATITVVLVTGNRAASLSVNQAIEVVAIPEGRIVAQVDNSVLLLEDIRLAGIDPSSVSEWIEDELLAEIAVEHGLENTRLSRLIQNRARQLYLRDELLSSVYCQIPFPDSTEVYEFMKSDSLLYMVERHYYQILVADRQLADSIHTRLSWGESFQMTAERLSIGQKAGIGGDLGFLTAGELIAYGVPREYVTIDGLGGVIESQYGWHIFLVDDIRPLTDTSRVIRILADDIYRNRHNMTRDSLVNEAMESREVFLDSTLICDEPVVISEHFDSDGREREAE